MSFARAIATVGGYTMLSRLAGFARDILVAAMLGAGPIADAFFLAFKLPNFFRRLFAEGAFALAFVPLFAKELHAEGKASAAQFAREAQAALLLVLVPLTIAMVAGMPWVIDTLAPGLPQDSELRRYAIEFGRLMFPYLLFISLVSLYGGVLNSLDRFAYAAAAPLLLNLALIGALLGLTRYLPNGGYALSWGVFAAGILQWLWLLLACRREGVGLGLVKPQRTERVARLLTLIVPAAIGGGVQQINAMLDAVWTSFLVAGSFSWLYYAERLMQLPLSVVGAAIGSAALPLLARQLRAGDEAGASDSQNRAIEYSLLFAIPAAVGLAMLAEPIVRTLFERGRFGDADARAAAAALSAYALGLPGFVLAKAFAPSFYAREDAKTPLRIALACIVVAVLAAPPLLLWLDHVGVALASSISGLFNAGLMYALLRRRGHLVLDARLARNAARIAVASGVLALALWGAMRVAGPLFATGGEAMRAAALVGLIGLALAVYFGVGVALGVVKPREMRSLLRRSRADPAASGR